jgi:hypothetical protein
MSSKRARPDGECQARQGTGYVAGAQPIKNICLTLRHVGHAEARVARPNPKNERSPTVAALHLTKRNLAVGAAVRGQQHVLLVAETDCRKRRINIAFVVWLTLGFAVGQPIGRVAARAVEWNSGLLPHFQ